MNRPYGTYRYPRYATPRQQTIRCSDGRKIFVWWRSPGNWSRTVTYPDGRRWTAESCSTQPMATLGAVALAMFVPAVTLGYLSIPIYLVEVTAALLWLRHRSTTRSKSEVTSSPVRSQDGPSFY